MVSVSFQVVDLELAIYTCACSRGVAYLCGFPSIFLWVPNSKQFVIADFLELYILHTVAKF